jgi:hypothetical protein
MSSREFAEWKAEYSIEPFGDLRDDYRSAQIAAMIAEVNRDHEKQSEPRPLKDFLLDFRPTADDEDEEQKTPGELYGMIRNMVLFSGAKREHH